MLKMSVMKQINEFNEEEVETSEQSPVVQYEANIFNLLVFTSVIGLGLIQAGFAISGNNQNAPVIRALFGWDEEEAIL